MFEQLKNHPKMALVIDKLNNASPSSLKRSAQWLFEKMVEVVEIQQLEENTQSVDKDFSQMRTKVQELANGAQIRGGADV